MVGDYKIFISGLPLIPLTYSNSLVAIWGWVLHLANFALPALALAALLAPAVTGRSGLSLPGLWRVWRWLAASGLLVLVAGLAVFGRDGKMATYAALVLVLASVACWLQPRQPQPPGDRSAH
jgi:hypothetical protein